MALQDDQDDQAGGGAIPVVHWRLPTGNLRVPLPFIRRIDADGVSVFCRGAGRRMRQ
jgi:hypothetical protein